MAEPIDVTAGVRIPAGALEARATKSGGPGGQNVNKVASRIELLVDLSLVEGLEDAARSRLAALASRRLSADGRLRVVAQDSRDQRRNLETAREKVRRLVEMALVAPRVRRATRVSAGARERRLQGKKRDAGVKATRRAVGSED